MPINYKDMVIIKIAMDDKIKFEEIDPFELQRHTSKRKPDPYNHQQSIQKLRFGSGESGQDENEKIMEKFTDFINNDNDVYYLQTSFPEFYQQSLMELDYKEGSLKGTNLSNTGRYNGSILQQNNNLNQSILKGINNSHDASDILDFDLTSASKNNRFSKRNIGGSRLEVSSSNQVNNLLSICFEDSHGMLKQGNKLPSNLKKQAKNWNENPLLFNGNNLAQSQLQNDSSFSTENFNMGFSNNKNNNNNYNYNLQDQSPISQSKSENVFGSFSVKNSLSSKLSGNSFFNRKFNNLPQINWIQLSDALTSMKGMKQFNNPMFETYNDNSKFMQQIIY
ncbi:hypothetical protein PPERSA_07757 [Pseudocohnilembus persalinus]|uniref:Uncharacterized protein n=1 Tax=Pseudocohnilembus persalinus TaxID=266149 RepID=A0A0V0RA37_PSEPJ|nr:hypothetical protein PPERSA_07757 [Pseudocohnilembus persalinus]|eukprot:KRX11232.1 hypothetical protein PPERSA_07757 [Pseudocohnilembus persalinus]